MTELEVSDADVLELTREALVAHGRDEVDMPAKIAIHPEPDSGFHAAPAYLMESRACGIKWSAGFPANAKHGLPQIAATLILNDADTGLPIAVMDATWITARRTAAVSALACQALARADSSVLAIAGCGVQGRAHLDMLPLVLDDIAEVRLLDVRAEACQRLADHAAASFDSRVVTDPLELLSGADIAISATAILGRPEPFLRREWVCEGSLVLPVDFDSAWDPSTWFEVDKLIVDSIAQMEYFQSAGYLQDGLPAIYSEIGKVVAGLVPGRGDDRETIVSLHIGMGVEDVRLATEVYRRAIAAGKGTWLPM